MGEIGVGLLGLGVVGGKVFEALNRRDLPCGAGISFSLRRILVRDLQKKRAIEPPPHLLTTNPDLILDDPEIDIVIEVMGGEHPALEYIRRALCSGKHVITANKEVIAKHGLELFSLAARKGVHLLFEASVGGGIPVISCLRDGLPANEILSIRAIINGTTNFILSKMEQEGWDFPSALKDARELGYAEANPEDDISGRDAVYKLAILVTSAFRLNIKPEDIYREGIDRIEPRDFQYAHELGYTIKLLAIAKREGRRVEARVHPVLIPLEAPLAKVSGAYNAVEFGSDLAGSILLYGEGAGGRPTSSAILADLIFAARASSGERRGFFPSCEGEAIVKPFSELETSYYLRLEVVDKPGALAQITGALGRNEISIASLIQRERDRESSTAEVVIMTYRARESAVQKALEEIDQTGAVRRLCNLIRVEEG